MFLPPNSAIRVLSMGFGQYSQTLASIARCLDLELTEGGLMTDAESTASVLKELKAMGSTFGGR
jgi:EAL domain-containing protein (putative c-di-GMP-specific phosphodiesterase class I)